VTFSGGEPFLKKDIEDIVRAFYTICSPKIINIPTNGILTQKIISKVKYICEHCPKSQITVNLSIDGVGEQHDKIRRHPDGYKKVMRTYKELKKLDIPNLSVGIHTVISKYNVSSFSTIANTLLNLKPDQYITEIAEQRNELGSMDLDITPDIQSYRAVADFLIHRIKNSKMAKRIHKITQAFRIEYYDMVKRTLKYNKKVLPCYAGVASCHISPDGDIWACCIKAQSFGNLKQSGYNFSKIWRDKPFIEQRKSKENKHCHCPLANVAYTNMIMDFPTLARVFYRSFIKWWN
jgi:MoaA/NifB/PqqE/SkfB family radical SAM enzyme